MLLLWQRQSLEVWSCERRTKIPLLGIPNTTNLIDGHFSNLKRMLRSHNGITRERRDKLVVGFFEASRELPEGEGLSQ